MTHQSTQFLCRLDDLPDPGSRGFDLGGGREIFVVRRGPTVVAYENSCPHTGGPLDWLPDQFLSSDATHIQCATHDARFSIEDGECFSGPCVGDRLTAVPIRVGDDGVWLGG